MTEAVQYSAPAGKNFLIFYRNNLALIALLFFCINLALIFTLHIPEETNNIRYEGSVIGYTPMLGAESFPIVEYIDGAGAKQTYTDKSAMISVAGQGYANGDKVTVTIPKSNPTFIHIGPSFLSRWWMTLTLMILNVAAVMGVMLAHIKAKAQPINSSFKPNYQT